MNRGNLQSFNPQPSSFGLIGWLEQTRVQLPLKGVECRFHVCGDLLSVEIDQIFHQNSAQSLDCLYSFPLPAGAAVHRCEMHVNDRMIRARVEEQGRAREIAREQKAAGRRTALVEMERENLFTLTLGNLQPSDLVIIRFAYFQTLTRLADWTTLRIPFCPGVRYVPGQPLLRALRGEGVQDDTDQVPDASRLSPPRIDALHPDAAYLSVRGEIEQIPGTIRDLSSPSHPVLVQDGGDRWTVTLAERDAVPDGDFSLRWTEPSGDRVRSAAWAWRDGGETYALLLLQAPKTRASTPKPAHDFYFLVDRSGSMAGLKWTKAVQSFLAFLQHLGPNDRAWLTLFDNQWQDFSEKPLLAQELTTDAGLDQLEKLGARGGTELLPALKHVLEVMLQHSADRTRSLILITDGQVGNEAQILECLRPHLNLRVHTFGIDTAVNDALLTRLAESHRGSSCLLQPTDDIVGAVTRLGSRLHQPVLTNLAAVDGWQSPSDAIPDLHSDECVSLSVRHSSADAKEVVICGNLESSPAGGQANEGREKFHFPLTDLAEPAIRLLWASRRIRFFLERGQRAEALALARQHNLLCAGAAFIAWDESQQVSIAQHHLYQPSHESLKSLKRAGKYVCYEISPPDHGIRYRREMSAQAEDTFVDLPIDRPGKSLDADQIRALCDLADRAVPSISASDFSLRLEAWVRLLTRSAHFPVELNGERLFELLVNWVLAEDADALRRLRCLEDLIARLQAQAPIPEAAMSIAPAWVELSMRKEDPFRSSITRLLHNIGGRLAKIRQQEMREGRPILRQTH